MRPRGVTLVEVLVAAGLFAFVLTAVLSFYIEAAAVSAKRDQHSTRLRRFHLGLDKMEQMLRSGRLVDLTPRSIIFMPLAEGSEAGGFPLYQEGVAQLASTEEGVLLLRGQEEQMILPLEAGEEVVFRWIQENPPDPPRLTTYDIALYHSGEGQRSKLFFHRTLNTHDY